MQTQAQIKAVLESEAVVDGDIETLPIELDAIPGAVWQAELHGLMPPEVRVSLFERGSQKCALLRFPSGQAQRALEAFDTARQGANEVSRQAHQAARQARGEVERERGAELD
jgi:hypothetical protein